MNPDLFHPVTVPKMAQVVWSGDTRERKGGDTVRQAIKGLSSTDYFRKGIAQEDMAALLCSGVVFVDGHRRGGWCNPVMEAMACGLPVVCTDTPCNSDFAVDGVNCLRVPMSDAAAMRSAVDWLLSSEELRRQLSENALATAALWSHDKAAGELASWLQGIAS